MSKSVSGGVSALDNASIQTWWSKDLAEHLGIGVSTLRKWSLELESAGYKFIKDEHERRAYVEHDALALRQLKKYLDGGMKYDSAAKAVTAEYLRSESAQITPYAKAEFPQEQSNERYDELNNKMDSLIELHTSERTVLIEMIKELTNRLNERDIFIGEQLSELKKSQVALPASEEQKPPTNDNRPWLSRTLTSLIGKKFN